MTGRPKIVVTGMLNTKGPELRHLASAVAEAGGDPIVVDLSLGAAVDWADVPLAEVLAATGTPVEAVYAAPRATAIELVSNAGAAKVLAMRAEGRCDGIVSWAGAVGTTTVTAVMRALPFGVPKVMLTDMASGDVSVWLGTKDIWIVNPTAEHGVNVVTRKAVANAAAAVVAMAKVPEIPAGSRPLAALTSYGSTTPCVLRCTEFMEERGWDTAGFHSVGAGATMEDLIRSGLILALFDITLGEVANTVVGSPWGLPRTWDGERMTAAGAMGIPQVVVPGGLDQGAHGPLENVPQAYLDDTRAERRRSFHGTGEPYIHNAGVTILSLTDEEVAAISEGIALALSATTGPTAFVIPMRGWSAYDQPAETASRERGWAEGNGDGPCWDPDPANSGWSRRAVLMRSILADRFDASNEHLDLVATDMHILDPEFSDLLCRAMGDMLDGRWRKGLYRDVPGVIA
jgi:uncharacterized protein (UPF0261 family)